MVRVLHVVGDSKFGGGSIIVLRLAEAGKKLGWHVDVLTTDTPFQEALRLAGVGVVSLDCIWRPIHPVRDWVGLYRLYRFLRSANYTVVHTHTSKAGFVGRLAAKMARVPVIVHTVHGFAFHEESSLLAVWFYATLEKLAAYAADRVVTVSEFHRAWALRLGISNAEKLVAIPNGIALERVRPSRAREDIRRDLGLAPEDFAILATGRLAPQKGLEYLLQATPILRTRMGRPFAVLLAGDGPSRRRLEELVSRLGIATNVRFLGFRTDVGDLLHAADLVVLPSLWEGLSIALLEAMSARKPIITTAIGSNLEVTAGGATAILIPPKDPEALANAVIRLSSEPREAERLAEAAYNRYVAHYTEERMLRAYIDEYLAVLRVKGGRGDIPDSCGASSGRG